MPGSISAPRMTMTGQCTRYSEYEMSPTYVLTGLRKKS